MEQTWRWFGKNDKITLSMLRQIGVEGIVTALHDVPNGEVWSQEKIGDLKQFIEHEGLRWSVVESLPVSESIKYGGPDREQLIENYKQSLINLASQDIHVVCYNFMPVLDWARTDLLHPNPNGTSNLFFSHAQFAYFDICILKREGAENDYAPEVLAEVESLREQLTPEDEHRLVENIIVKTQGFVSGNIKEDDEHPVELFRQLLALYKGITKEQLRENMRYFLEAIMPVCEEYDMYMCVHPDDPPFPILGLPRIVNCEEASTGSSRLLTIRATDSRSAQEVCRRVFTTTWWPWPGSMHTALGSCTCVRARCFPMATSLKPVIWGAGQT